MLTGDHICTHLPQIVSPELMCALSNHPEPACDDLSLMLMFSSLFFSLSSDIWSLGVILFMLVCGQPPFQEANDSETLTMIMDCKYTVPARVSGSCKE